jgi:phosphatidylglycerophosphate synthase
MIDGLMRRIVDPYLARAGRALANSGIGADSITLVGFALGLAGVAAIASGHFAIALLLLAANRIADGLDGAVARATRLTDRGAFLDITLDFFLYAAVPLGFAWWNEADNALPAALLLASFVANGSAFLAFSALAEKRGLNTRAPQVQRSIYYLAGLAEGFETIVFMAAVCIVPSAFPLLATTFAVLCLISAITRLFLGWKLLSVR